MSHNEGALSGGALIGMGSFGCVFNPSLRCPGEKSGQKEVVSKVFFTKDGKKELRDEFKISSLIKSIKGYEKWAEVWFKKCKPSEYHKIYEDDPEIEDCLEENNIDKHDFNNIRMMMQGHYGGLTFADHVTRQFTRSIFSSAKEFTKEFMKIMKSMKPLFIGIKELYKHEIGHNDIKNENIVIDSKGCRLIDFGFASRFTDKKFYKTRSSLEFATDRIYPPYPYEFIYLYATTEVLEENDKQDLRYDINRSLHDRYKMVHEAYFKRETKQYLKNLVTVFIEDKPRSSDKSIVSMIDTYSLGMVFPYTLCKLAKKYGKMKTLQRYNEAKGIKSFVDLFKHMTDPDARNRMGPTDVYDKYCELEKLYLQGGHASTKRTKRK